MPRHEAGEIIPIEDEGGWCVRDTTERFGEYVDLVREWFIRGEDALRAAPSASAGHAAAATASMRRCPIGAGAARCSSSSRRDATACWVRTRPVSMRAR